MQTPPHLRSNDDDPPAGLSFVLKLLAVLALAVGALILLVKFDQVSSNRFRTPVVVPTLSETTTSWITNQRPGCLIKVPIQVKEGQTFLTYVRYQSVKGNLPLDIHPQSNPAEKHRYLLVKNEGEAPTIIIEIGFALPQTARLGDRVKLVLVPVIDGEARLTNATEYEFGVDARVRPPTTLPPPR